MTNRFLSFDDVLLKPQFSSIISRSMIDLTSEMSVLKFANPLIVSPMDTVVNARMATAARACGSFAILHRYCSIDEQVAESSLLIPGSAAAIGMTGDFKERAQALWDGGNIDIFCIDVAHGHHQMMKDAIEWLKKELPDVVIIAGNVATAEGYTDLARWGADAIRVGIGSGCFLPGTPIRTKPYGDKLIEEVEVGDFVLTHDGTYQEVEDTLIFDRDEEIIVINDEIECTKNHEFYVIDKKHKNVVSEDNLAEYAKWIPAEKLNKDKHLLVELD